MYLPYARKGQRIPLYFNFIKEVGDDMAQKMKEAEVPWDTSGYLPVPVWREHHPLHNMPAEYDLYAFAFKECQSNFSESTTIPWIEEVIGCQPLHLGVMINSKTARKKGIKTGDILKLESPFGEISGRATVCEEVHPECVAISNTISRWSQHPVGKQKVSTHFNKLLPADVKWTDSMSGHLETSTKVKLSIIS
jgi:anaerobic selenocysteine-containing dehydrogenase